jgi:hypothetical protein
MGTCGYGREVEVVDGRRMDAARGTNHTSELNDIGQALTEMIQL